MQPVSRQVFSQSFCSISQPYSVSGTENIPGSGNAPEFRVLSESQDPERAKKLNEEGMALVKEIISNCRGSTPKIPLVMPSELFQDKAEIVISINAGKIGVGISTYPAGGNFSCFRTEFKFKSE